MKSKVLLGLASLSLMMAACDSMPISNSAKSISANSSDDQKFAYMLGAQFALQNFNIVPLQMGEELDEDVVVQAILDSYKANKDTNFKLQVSVDSLRRVGFDYNANARSFAGWFDE